MPKIRKAKKALRERGYGYIRCSICGKRVRYKRGYHIVNGIDPGRLIAIRRHWKRKHPRAWRKSIIRGVRKRKETREKAKLLRARL